MSGSLVTAVNCGGKKFYTSVKQPPCKTNQTEIKPSPLILFTVEYSENDKLSTIFPKPNGTTQEISNIQRAETLPCSLLQLNGSVIKDVTYEGIKAENNKRDSELSPTVVLRNNAGNEQSPNKETKESYSEQSLLNNFLFSPLPKSVVCTVMPKEDMEKPYTIIQNTANYEIPVQLHEDINGIGRLGDFDEYSSGEDDTVHVISDVPVTCRALASLPVKFLYFGRTTKSKGVFAKIEIPRKAQFGPMEGVLCHGKHELQEHHLDLTVIINGTRHWLDISNENTSNWMRYVRPAESIEEQNLILNQTDENLYFIASRRILPGEEMKAWYSLAYAKARNLTYHGGITSTIKKENSNNIGKKSDLVSIANESIERKWKCLHCQRVFKNATLLNLHVLTHAADNLETNSENLTSVITKDRNGSSRNMKNNLSSDSTIASFSSSDTSVKMFDCPICKEVFHKVRDLKEHIPSHALAGHFSCPYCSKKFQEYKHIRNHIRRFHCGKNFACANCSKCFATADKLKMHLLSHSDTRDFSCVNCGRQFKRKDKLCRHLKRKSCLVTEKRARASKKMIREVVNLKNYSNFVYKCHICVRGFKRRGMLVNHLAKQHPGITPESVPELNLPILKENKDYYCQYCDKIYKSSSKRKSHILKKHPGEKLPLNIRQASSKDGSDKNGSFSQTVGRVTTNPQRCEWCHKQYASKTKLINHQREVHPNYLSKSLHPKGPGVSNSKTEELEERDDVKEVVEKVTDAEMFLSDSLELSEYELSVGDSKFISDGEFILDANSLKRAIKGEVLGIDCSPATLAELGHIIEARPDGYFKVFQGPSGITLARPVEVWDPLSLCLSPPSESSFILPPSHLLQPMQ